MARTPGPPESGGPTALPPSLDPRGARAARRAAAVPGARVRRVRSRASIAARITAAVLSLAILLGSGYAWSTYQRFNADIASGADLDQSGADSDGRDQNILLIGNDSRMGATPEELRALATEDDGGSVNTDTMIVLHVPADGSRASLISFPRDSYVDIPGHGQAKINAAYSYAYNDAKNAGDDEVTAQAAGIRLTADTISQLTGLRIDHYLQVNLLGFYRISEAVGGIDVCLTAPQNDPYSGINLPAGRSTIEGTQALAFVRQRHGLPRGDLDRIARQQYFLGAVFRKVSSAGTLVNPFKLNDLLDAVSSSLLKDKSFDLLSLAQQVQDLRAGNITFATIPTTGDITTDDGQDALGVDVDAVRQEISQLVANTAQDVAEATAAAPDSFTVDVQNGGNVAGAATTNADLLGGRGFTVGTVGNAPNGVDATTIAFPPGQAGAAKALAAVVPGAVFQQTSAVSTVTLVLGADGKGVTPAADTSSAAASADGGGAAAAPATGSSAAPAGGAAEASTGDDISCIN